VYLCSSGLKAKTELKTILKAKIMLREQKTVLKTRKMTPRESKVKN